MGNLKSLVAFIKKIRDKFQEDDPVIYCAGIAFFAVISIPAVIVILVYLGSFAFRKEAVLYRIAIQISERVGPAGAKLIQRAVENVTIQEISSWSTALGGFLLLLSATVVFIFIQKTLNKVWNVKPKPKSGILKFIVDRTVSILVILVLGFLMLLSLFIDLFLSLLRKYLWIDMGRYTLYLISSINFLVITGIETFIFAILFKLLPDTFIKWKNIWIGALFTESLFIIGKYLIGLILKNVPITSTYGAAGSLAAVLLWVFYSTIILVIGAEFIYVYTEKKGENIVPNQFSVKVESREVEE